MNEPVRLRSLGSDAPAGARELLAVARRPRPMSAEVRARTAAKVAALAAAPVAIGAGAKWLTGKTAAWLLGFGLLGGAIGVAAWSLSGPKTQGGVVSESPQTSTVAASPAQTASATATIAASALSSAPPSSSAAPAPIAPPSTKPLASIDQMALETALLEPARAKVESDPAAALAALDAHRKSHPNGKLAEEREALAVKALVRLGRTADAKTRGEAFLAKYPSSFYAPVVRKLIQ